MASIDTINGLYFLLVLVPIMAWVLVFMKQYNDLNSSVLRLQVLSTRCALCLPIYSFLMYISFVAPSSFNALEIPIAIAEGYFFCCFFVLLVENLGGPKTTIKVMNSANRDIYCSCCCPSSYNMFYKRVKSAVVGFLLTRTAVVILQTITGYIEGKLATTLTVILALISFCFVVRGFGSLVVFYENIYNYSTNISGVYKLLVIKMSVGIIVLQGIIVEILVAFNVIHMDEAHGYTEAEMIQRLYCFIVLIEYVVLSVVMYFAFATKIKVNDSVSNSLRDHSEVEAQQKGSNYVGNSALSISLGQFLLLIFSVTDLKPTLTKEVEELNQSLISNAY